MSDSFESVNLRSGYTDELMYLKEMADNDESFVKEIITHFLRNGPELLSSMRQSALAGDNLKLRFAAHKLLPQLSFVGILAAIPFVSKIEEESKTGNDLSDLTERAIKIINYGIEDLKKMI
jgi:HPt (histidine-containing phosphotransfer) domain-containing protein